MNEEPTSKPMIQVTALKEPVSIQLPPPPEVAKQDHLANVSTAERLQRRLDTLKAQQEELKADLAEEQDPDTEEVEADDPEPVAPVPSFQMPSAPLRPVTPKQPSDAPIFIGILLFLVAAAGLISIGLWYSWPKIQKYAEAKGWTKPLTPAEATVKETVRTELVSQFKSAEGPAATAKTTYYHVACIMKNENGTFSFRDFQYELTDGEKVNPLVLIHNLRVHAAQTTGVDKLNITIIAISQLPGGAR